MHREPRQKRAVKIPIVCHAQRLTGVPLFIHRHEHGKLLVSITSDKLFHIAAAPPCAWGFARSLRETRCSDFIASLSVAFPSPFSGALLRSLGSDFAADSIASSSVVAGF